MRNKTDETNEQTSVNAGNVPLSSQAEMKSPGQIGT